MSFSADWLGLREPADHTSINAAVRLDLMRATAHRASLKIVDLGCGTGSNVRGLSPWLGANQIWTLVDYDAALLAVAKARLLGYGAPKAIDISYVRADLSSGDVAALIEGADLVTASALFDLVSVAVVTRLAAAVAANRQIFATVLTYDGIAAWLPEHPIDRAMRDAFNAHQTGDKGFGPAAGPAATDAIAAAFTAHGYRIVRGRSPWVLDRSHAHLRRELDMGWAAAVLETGQVAKPDVEAWLHHRAAAGDAAVTIVGHEDIVCLPPA
jgi:SAM-dependent methyltransferase